ncbi:protein of unknown function [Cupriavidus taiwanensis]|nr:protein of unknown function [Cupriavidus taiwanensis]
MRQGGVRHHIEEPTHARNQKKA